MRIPKFGNRHSALPYIVLGGLLVAGAAVAAFFQLAPAPRPLATLTPAGPMLVLEARDLAALVKDWDSSTEKKLWLQSANFEEFSRSRLYLRLDDARQEFATAAGLSPDMDLVRSVAGGESLIALYDIGKLEFLYITRMPAARAAETVLWQTRSKFQPRNAGGTAYCVSTVSGRTVAFSAVNDLLLLATREDLLAGALGLIAGGKSTAVSGENWYSESVRAAAHPGDLRLVMNLDSLARSAYFRSYWIQRNVSELRGFSAGVSDLFRSPAEIREERVFLRSSPPSQTATPGTGVESLMPLIPPDAGLYRAWAAPTADSAAELLAEKILAPRAQTYSANRIAPGQVTLTGGAVGSEADLETMINEPPPENAAAIFVPGPLHSILEKAGLQGMLQLQSTHPAPGGVFIGMGSAVVLLGGNNWDAQAVRSALVTAVEGLWSHAQLGLNWVERKQGNLTWHALNGLMPLAVAVDGRYLVVAKDEALLVAALGRIKPGAATPSLTTYAAGFRHARESADYRELMRALDHVSGGSAAAAMPEAIQTAGEAEEGEAPSGAGGSPAAPRRPPHFFSENVGSLSDTLARVQSATIVTRDSGASRADTVIYRLTK